VKKEDTAYLRHILDAITRIEEYTAGIGYEDFIENHLIQDGVMRQIETIGEAAKRLSDMDHLPLTLEVDGGTALCCYHPELITFFCG
jgi:hypothetical protein